MGLDKQFSPMRLVFLENTFSANRSFAEKSEQEL